jgi:ABC-type Zn2+ transport system substrate-binding protein/surface adhesin
VFSYVNLVHVVLVQDYLHCSHTKCLKINSFTDNFELEQANDCNSLKLKSNIHNNDDDDDDNNNNNNKNNNSNNKQTNKLN